MMRRALLWLLERVGPALVRGYFCAIRVRENERSRQLRRGRIAGVFAFWHAHQFAALKVYQNLGARILISRSKDGELIARIARGMGCRPVRGSSSRGGSEAGRALVKAARRGRPVAVTPDGPRGPRHQVHGGVLFVARMAGQPVWPVAIGFSDYWEIDSWDRFRIPKPFSRGVALVGDPIRVPSDGGAEEKSAAGERLREALIALEAEADRQADEWAKACGGARRSKRRAERVKTRESESSPANRRNGRRRP